jgi:uncharacterized protein involved in outer membrane biogenesis
MWHDYSMQMPRRIVVVAVVVLVVLAGLALSVRVLLGGDHIKAAVESQASAALGSPVTIQAAVPRLLPRVGLDLTGITIGATREVTIDRARLTTGFRALLRGRVEDAEISVEHSRIDLRWALSLLGALADSSPSKQTATAPAALIIESIGTLTWRDVTLVAGARTLLVDLDSSFTAGDRFVVSRLHGRSEGSDLVASGELASVARRTGTFAIDAQTLDLDGLMAFLAAATPAGARENASTDASAAPPVAAVPLQLDITVAARQGRALGVAFTKLETAGKMRGGVVALEGLKLEAFGGRFAGSAGFDGSQREPRYQWRGTFENLDVPALVAFAGSPGSMTGRLAGTVALAAAGVEPLQAMERARGTARVILTDGRVPGLDIVRTIVLAFGKPSGERPAGSGEAFTRLAASLAVAGPTLTTSDLTLASRDLDMTGEGTLSLASQAVNLRADVMLSRELSAQAGRDLYRLAREGDRIVVPARIGGTVASPTVFVDVQAALNRALRNRAEDEIKSFLNRLGKRIK